MNLKISVNQVEGFDVQSQSTGCYLSVDGDFIDVITPITSKTSTYFTDLPSSGILKILLKNMRSGDLIGSTSVSIESLYGGTFWLPLSEDVYNDFVSEILTTVESPKIEISIITEDRPHTPLLTISTEKADVRFSKLQEEYEASLKRAEERDAKNLAKIEELTNHQLELQTSLTKTSNTLDAKNQEIIHLTERIKKLAIENWESDYLMLKQSIESSQDDIQSYKTLVAKLQEELKESNEIALSLTAINLNSCPFHEEEIQKLNTQIFTLKQTIIDLQRNQTKKTSGKVESELIRQIKELDEKLEASEIAKQDLIAEVSELRQEMAVQEKLLLEMKGFIEGSRTERLSLRDSRAKSPTVQRRKDSIDRSLEEYHVGQGIKNNFIKLGRGLYEFGNRKVNVSMKNGTIICRVGGGYVQIDDFLNIYLASLSNSPKKTPSRGNSTSPARVGRGSYQFSDFLSGKQTPSILDSVFDTESLLNYSCDSEDSRKR